MTQLWAISAHDNGSYFLDEDKLTADDVCPVCGLLINHGFAPRSLEDFKAAGRDASSTYDNRLILSESLADFIQSNFPDEVDLVSLKAGRQAVFAVFPRAVAQVSESRTNIRRGDLCDVCVQYDYEMLPHPLCVKSASLEPGASFYRTNIEFGSNLGKRPLVVVTDAARRTLEASGFKGLEWIEVGCD